ncbi:MAG: hypothetical protein AAGD38_01000 [Acidobacteriota bacterium]
MQIDFQSRQDGRANTNWQIGGGAVATPLPSGLSREELIWHAVNRFSIQIQRAIKRAGDQKLLYLSNQGDEAVAEFICRFLGTGIAYFAPDAVYDSAMDEVEISGDRYKFEWSEPDRFNSIQFRLVPLGPVSDTARHRRTRSIKTVPRYDKLQLYVPKMLKSFKVDLVLELIKRLLEHGYILLSTELQNAAYSFQSSETGLASSLYSLVRTEAGLELDRDGFLLASVPKNRDHIMYLVDDEKIRQILERVTPYSLLYRQSPLALTAEIIQNHLEFEVTYARHAIRDREATPFDFGRSDYDKTFPLLKRAEIAWFGPDFVIDPIYSGTDESLMAVYGTQNADEVHRKVSSLADAFMRRYDRFRGDTLLQSKWLNRVFASTDSGSETDVDSLPAVTTKDGDYRVYGANIFIERSTIGQLSLGDGFMGDSYEVRGQAAYVGPGGVSLGASFQQVYSESAAELDLAQLAGELDQLRNALRQTATETAHDRALAVLAEAQEAAEAQDGPRTLEHLSRASQWVLGKASDIGVKLAVKAIEVSMGIGGAPVVS